MVDFYLLNWSESSDVSHSLEDIFFGHANIINIYIMIIFFSVSNAGGHEHPGTLELAFAAY
jgi:hypothetical protein